MTLLWALFGGTFAVLLLIVMVQDRRRGRRSRRGGRGAAGAAETCLREYRRQAMAESGFLVPSGMTHEVRSNGPRRGRRGG